MDPVSISKAEHEVHERALLSTLVTALGLDTAYDREIFHPKDFPDTPNTVWSTLAEQGALETRHQFGLPGYKLTGHGWIAGLESTGLFDSAEVRDRCKRTAAGLKGCVDRNAHHNALVDHWTLAAKTELSEDWLFSCLKSELLQAVFPHQEMNAYWDDRRGVRVPPTFGRPR